MKKELLLFVVCYAMLAQADTHNYLVFTNTIGTSTVFSINNLTLNVDGTNLQVTNIDGTAQLLLTELESMEFSMDGMTALENVLDADPLGKYGAVSLLLCRKCRADGSYGDCVIAERTHACHCQKRAVYPAAERDDGRAERCEIVCQSFYFAFHNCPPIS